MRALKGLVKIQALVRGFLVRKRATQTLHNMQALIRAQTSVRSQRARRSITKQSQARKSMVKKISTHIQSFNFSDNHSYFPYPNLIYYFLSVEILSICHN